MNYVAALITKTGKIVCGINHGIAFAQLTEEERIEVISGFVTENKFFTEDCDKVFLMKEIIIIRHGQSRHNIGLTDDLDSELTENGYNQCINTAKYLKKYINLEDWSGFTSPFLRCLQTSSIISLLDDIKFTVDVRLRENPCLLPAPGLFISKRDKEFCQFDWSLIPYPPHLVNNGSEEYINSLKESIEAMPEKAIIVTHGTAVMTLADMAQGSVIQHLPPWDVKDPRKWIDNASITHIRNQQLVCWGKLAV